MRLVISNVTPDETRTVVNDDSGGQSEILSRAVSVRGIRSHVLGSVGFIGELVLLNEELPSQR